MADIPKVFNRQIEASPAVVIQEGDNATITCEKPASDTSEVYWVLIGSHLLNETVIVNNSQQSVFLINGRTLDIQLNESTNVYEGNQSFSITISDLTLDSSGLTVKCGVWSEEENVYNLYEQPAMIAVLPRPPPNKCKELAIYIYSC